MIVIKKQLKNNNHFLMLGNCTNPNDKKYRILYFKKVGKKDWKEKVWAINL